MGVNDWPEIWKYLSLVVMDKDGDTAWEALSSHRILPLADETLHRMNERKRILCLPEGAYYNDATDQGAHLT